jgi:hypothetical protein
LSGGLLPRASLCAALAVAVIAPTGTRRRRGPRALSRRGYRHAAQLPAEPAGVEVLAAVKVARERRGREFEWDARLETSLIAMLAYLWRRGRGEKWAGRQGSARYACSIAQLVMGVAEVMGWQGTREQLVARHRKSVQRWLDWLADADLVSHTPQQDEEGWWWRTIIELHRLPDPPVDVLGAAVERRRGWSVREQQRERRGRRRPAGGRLRNLSAILRRARLTRAQRRARAVARRRAERVYTRRQAVRAAIHASLAAATVASASNGHLPQPNGAETTSRIAPKSNPRPEACESTFTRAPTQDLRSSTPATSEQFTTALRKRGKPTAAESVRAAGEGMPRAVGQLDNEVWAIASDGSRRWRGRPRSEWQPLVDAIEQRTAELQDWPLGRCWPLWRLLEAWTMIAWGVEYAAAGTAARLPMWSPQHPKHGPRLQRALKRYERHREHRPPGWPDSGISALVCFLRREHPEPGRHPRCLAYDVAAFNRLTKHMAAYARVNDSTWQERARARAARRASAALQAAGEINRRLPERTWLKPAAELVPLPYPAPGADRRQRRLADRDRRLLAGQTPPTAGTLRAAWAYQDRWLR